jgi:DNA-binding NarL/FixJ family response regulator
MSSSAGRKETMMENVFPCGAGLDVPKQSVEACVRRIEPNGRLHQQIRHWGTMARDLLAMADWMIAQGVTHVAMESTGVFWKPIYNILESRFTMLLVNARHLKQVPGRKSDVRDCHWIAQLLQCGLLKGSFIPPRSQRELGESPCRRGTAIMRRPRVLLADDHQMLADALRGVLEPRCEVVGAVSDGRALLEAADRLQPDIVVLDIGMPLLNGFNAGRKLKHTLPNVKLIFMTMHEDPYLVGEAFRAGASAFLLKEAAASELTDAIDQVLKGGSYITPSASEGLHNSSLRDPKNREHTPEPTPRQREVIQLLAEGHSMKQVADELNITRRTVAGHKYAAMELLQLKTNADLVQYAIEHRIISLHRTSLPPR